MIVKGKGNHIHIKARPRLAPSSVNIQSPSVNPNHLNNPDIIMVSSKIAILAVVMFAYIMHTQAASSDDEDKKNDGGFSLSNLEEEKILLKNFNKILSEISKNPTQTFSILTNSIKGKAKGASKNKGSDKDDN
ncbi:unnamed protein product [Pieris macdunnoughi]|uniref:Uncharacterized protein n=1 Tax=Pieris macdunnoughi TaxID=345717 RepID=A0A821PNY2_9NEOP|nr:unnamed protein product [Pieris macdunnoughi]